MIDAEAHDRRLRLVQADRHPEQHRIKIGRTQHTVALREIVMRATD